MTSIGTTLSFIVSLWLKEEPKENIKIMLCKKTRHSKLGTVIVHFIELTKNQLLSKTTAFLRL
jgi:hypothetical protein